MMLRAGKEININCQQVNVTLQGLLKNVHGYSFFARNLGQGALPPVVVNVLSICKEVCTSL